MPAYKYEALDAAGKSANGIVEAESMKSARTHLRSLKLVPLGLTLVAVAETAGRPRRFTRTAFSSSGLAVWTRQLAGLVAAGLPLERALTALAEESEEQRQRDLIAHLRSEVNGGATFARALGSVPREFDEVYRAVVAAGEQSGALGRVLERLADDLEERQTLKGKLIGAMLYPAIVSVIAMAIVTFLVTYVVPQVASVFANGKHQLPFLTTMMLAISAFVREWGLLALAVIVVGFFMFGAALRQPAFRRRFDAAFLNVPLAGRLARGYTAARFAGTLAMLAGAGVPILKALQAAAETLSNHALRADAMEALVQVREGAPLASALAAHKRFPGLLAMFARLGEQTGQLPVMLDRAARQLGNEVQRRAFALATLLEPLLIVVMGAVVMVIVLSVLMPIIELNNFVK